MAKRQRITKSATSEPTEAKKDDPAATFELTNLRVEEVSLVDRPANQRVFLVKKRKADKADEAVVVDEADLEDLTQTAKGDLPGADLDAADAARIAAEAQAAVDAERERELTVAAEGDKAAVKASPPETPTPEPPATVTAPGSEPPPAEPPETPAPVTPPVPPESPTEENKPPAEKPSTSPSDVTKVGRPMRRERLERLKASVKALADMIGELDVEETGKGATPTGAAGQVLTTAPDGTVAFRDPAPDPAVAEALKKANEQLAHSAEEVKRLSGVVTALQGMVKNQGELLAKVSAPATSNAISLEKAENEHDKVSWDLDMAAPVRRLPGRTF